MIVYVLVDITNEIDPQKLQLNDLLVCVYLLLFFVNISSYTPIKVITCALKYVQHLAAEHRITFSPKEQAIFWPEIHQKCDTTCWSHKSHENHTKPQGLKTFFCHGNMGENCETTVLLVTLVGSQPSTYTRFIKSKLRFQTATTTTTTTTTTQILKIWNIIPETHRSHRKISCLPIHLPGSLKRPELEHQQLECSPFDGIKWFDKHRWMSNTTNSSTTQSNTEKHHKNK